MKFNIAIDGPSGAGKSIIALRLAKRFNLVHINSGAMYRAIAYKAHQLGMDTTDEEVLVHLIHHTDIQLTTDQKILCDQQDVSLAIRQEVISILASNISKFPKVRELLVKQQQALAKQKNCIMEGRDITTVVLPDAEVKIFLTATVDVRAQRRWLDLQAKGFTASLEEVKQDLILRDYQDSHREVAPLRIADDAVVVDATFLSIEEVLDEISLIVKQKVG